MTDGSRDLACAEYWEESIARSRRRRAAAERQLNFGPIDSKRIAVPAALLAGGVAATEGVPSGGGDGGGGVLPQDATAASATVPADHVTAKPAKTEPVAEKKPAEKKKPAAKRSAAKRSAPKGSAAKRSAPKKKKPVVIQTVSQAQALGGFKKGMRGAGVIQLQRQLGVTADGIYGPATLKAVHRLQKRHDLNTDGIVGPATWQAISAPAKSSTTRPAVQRTRKHHRKHSGGATLRAASLKRGGEVEALQG